MRKLTTKEITRIYQAIGIFCAILFLISVITISVSVNRTVRAVEQVTSEEAVQKVGAGWQKMKQAFEKRVESVKEQDE